jgi:mannose-6-phosphate isomerase-like protein (cupin superfamily)
VIVFYKPARRALRERRGMKFADTYLQLLDDHRVLPVPYDDEFWNRIDERTHLHAGRLLGVFDLGPGTGDHEEMHPNGDEILILLEGEIAVVIADQRVALAAGELCIVPRGTWHHFDVRRGGRLLFITPGEGTEHRPR